MAKDDPARDAVRLLAFIVGIPILGGAFAVFGAPFLNWFEVQVGLQSTPPPRPASVPAEAQPIAVYGDGAKVSEWKWAVCVERELPRYACRVYGRPDRLEIAGEYVAQAGRYRRRPGRLPTPGERIVLAYLQDPATLVLNSPGGGRLRARGVLFYPVSRTKAEVVDGEGRLGQETPMTAEELEALAR